MVKCPSCGRELSEEANFCDKCGASVRSSAIDQMVEDARRTLSSDPDDAAARYNLAIAYKLRGMEELAVQELRRVAEQQPDFVDVHYELGLLHVKSGRTKEAIEALSRTVELDPGHERAERLLRRLRERG